MTATVLQFLILGAGVFIPTFIVALAMHLPAARACALAGVFAIGAVLGSLLAQVLAMLVMNQERPSADREPFNVAFMAAGAVAGGAVALWLAGKWSKAPPWRRS
jgi:hypothetical protein